MHNITSRLLKNSVIATVLCGIVGIPAWAAIAVEPPSSAPVSQERTSGRLTLEDALLEAFNHNPTLAAVIAQRPVAQANVVQAKIRVNPTYNNQFAPAEATYHYVDIKTTTQLGLKRQRRIEVAQRQIDATNATIKTFAWKIRQDTESAFFELVIATEVLKVMQEYVAITERLYAIAEKRLAARDASGLDVLRADAAVSDARAQLVPAVVRVQQAQRQLNIVLGRDPDVNVQVGRPNFLQLENTVVQLPTYSQLLSTARIYRPEYRQNAADVQVQEARIKQAYSLRWPDVQVGMGMSSVPLVPDKNYFGTHVINRPFWYAQIPINIFDYGQGILANAKTTRDQLVVQRTAIDNQVEQELNVAYSGASTTAQQLAIFIKQTLPKQARVVVLTEKGYSAGAVDLTGAITAQQAALATRLNFLQAATQYYQALVAVERAVGKPVLLDIISTEVK